MYSSSICLARSMSAASARMQIDIRGRGTFGSLNKNGNEWIQKFTIQKATHTWRFHWNAYPSVGRSSWVQSGARWSRRSCASSRHWLRPRVPWWIPARLKLRVLNCKHASSQIIHPNFYVKLNRPHAFVVVDGGVIMPRSNLAVLKAQQPWECVTHVAEILYRRDREGWRDALIHMCTWWVSHILSNKKNHLSKTRWPFGGQCHLAWSR